MECFYYNDSNRIDICFYLIVLSVGGSKYECPSEGYQKDPQDCTKFYRCIDNGGKKLQAVHFDCAPGTVFSPETSNCVHPRDANRPECPDISENLVDGGDGGKI